MQIYYTLFSIAMTFQDNLESRKALASLEEAMSIVVGNNLGEECKLPLQQTRLRIMRGRTTQS